jgi:hypothetical protein
VLKRAKGRAPSVNQDSASLSMKFQADENMFFTGRKRLWLPQYLETFSEGWETSGSLSDKLEIHFLTSGKLSGISGNHVLNYGKHFCKSGSNPMTSGNLFGISGSLSGISGNVSGISGNVSGISGNVFGISGNVFGISGNVFGISGNLFGISGSLFGISGNHFLI